MNLGTVDNYKQERTLVHTHKYAGRKKTQSDHFGSLRLSFWGIERRYEWPTEFTKRGNYKNHATHSQYIFRNFRFIMIILIPNSSGITNVSFNC